MRIVCVMYKVVLRLNDLRSGYAYPHKYTFIQREKGCPNEGGSTPEASMTCSGCHAAIWA